jgi:ABC-type glutathione transport system ATPase component
VTIDLVLEVADGLGVLPERAVTIDVEPASTDPGEGLSQEASDGLERALELVRAEARRAPLLELADRVRESMEAERLESCGAVIAVRKLLGELELLEKRDAFPNELSRGMRQKLAIACGLLHEPRALLLDEPLTGLDPGGIRRMKATIRARAAAGVAVVLSSHLLHLVEELCTRLLVIRRGRVVALGTAAEIVAARPQLAGLTLEELFLALTDDAGSAADAAAAPTGA